MTRARVKGIAPFFVVRDVERSIAFYCDILGFETRFREPESRPFFAIVGRDSVHLFLKSEDGVAPLPNPERHPELKWDAYVSVPDPDRLAGEFAGRGAVFHEPLKDTSDGLRGFEIGDPDGYIVFFGRPR